MNLPAEKNRRILIIDDNRAIHDDFRKILAHGTIAAATLDVTEAKLFGKPAQHGGMVQQIRYEIDSAYQGQDGVLLVKQALAAGRPYAMAFVDVRMPPGMDGVETTRKIWELDPDLQVVLCTAYSDYSWGEMFEKLGQHDGLLVLKKPFDTVEALQLAHTLAKKWWLHQQSKRKMEELESRVAERTGELQQTNHKLQTEVVEHTRAEEDLRASHQIIEGIINAIPVRIFWKDKNLVYLGCNAAFARDAGFADPKDIIGKDDYQMGWRDRAELYRGDDRQVVESGCSKLLIEEPLMTSEGKTSTILTSKIPLRSSKGEISGLLGTYVDITERKQAETALIRLAAIVESSDDAIIGKDMDGIITSWNKGAEKLFGYTAGEMMGASIMRVIPADRQDEENQILEKLKRGESVEHFETLRQTRDGRLINVSVTASPIKDTTGKVVGVSKVARDITERKRAVEELQWKTAFLEAQVNSSIDGVLVVDQKGKKTLQNKRFVDLLKIPQHIADDKDDEEQLQWFVGKTKNPERFIEKIVHLNSHPDEISRDEIELKDGMVLDRYSSPVVGQDGKRYGRIWTFRDITERRQAEAALRSSEERFRIASETANDVIYEWDLKQSLEWLGRIDELLGYEPGEFPRTMNGFVASVYPEDLERTMAAIQAHLDGRVPYAVEYRVRRKDGVYRWWSARGAVARTPDGKPTRWIGSITDITERKQAEERLTQEHDLSEAILNNMPGLFYLITEKGRFLRWNRQLETVSGYSGEEIARMHPLDIFPAEHKGLVAEQILQVFKKGHGRVEANLLTKQGEQRPFYFTGGTVIVDGQPCLAGTGIDITGRKRLEAQLFQSQKLETVGKLAGGIAHQFNSILTVIIGQSELLLEDLPVGSPLAQNAIEISKAAERAATLTRQMLAYGRKQFLQPKALDLNQVITSMESIFHHLMGGDVDTQIVPAPGLKAVKADSGQIEQVIMNLAMNAHDAMPNGGKLTLETANISFDKDSVGRNPELKPGAYVMLAITDTGSGMSEKVKAHAFEPFFTTKGVGQGTGLGLSTCYGIIKQSGGHISVYSEPGRGTTFKIYLPQVEPLPKIPIERLDSPDLPRGTETILLVEDDSALREMAATLLKRLGYTVLSANHGIEALSLCHQRDTGHIDLLFTDVVMPHMSGKELADRVRALYPHTRILFTSAYTESAIVHQGVLDKGVALLQKPFTPSALAIKVREALDAQGVPQPDATQKTFGLKKTTDEVKTRGN